jgi:hypothetical protein
MNSTLRTRSGSEKKRKKRAAARATRQANSPSKTGMNALKPNGTADIRSITDGGDG